MDVATIVSQLTSHAKKTGLFTSVNTHEPKSAPANGLTCCIWAETIGPVKGGSGLDITSAYVVMSVRIYMSMLQQPYDAIDPKMIQAVDKMMSEYSGSFTLGGNVRAVDLFGMYGTSLSSRAGYINQDGKMYRIVTISLPLIINDTWTESP
jgi:hypothetical protein